MVMMCITIPFIVFVNLFHPNALMPPPSPLSALSWAIVKELHGFGILVVWPVVAREEEAWPVKEIEERRVGCDTLLHSQG